MAGCAAETGSRGGDVIGLVSTETSVTYTGDGGTSVAEFWLTVWFILLAIGLVAWALGFRNDD